MADNSNDLPHNIVGFVTDPVSKQVVMTLVKDLNIGYTEVINGATNEAVEFLKNNRSPKIIIIDISNSELPMSDIAKVRELGAPNMNIIAIGSKNDVGLFRDFLSIGISDYLVKPINTALLKKSIDDANSGHKLEIKGKIGKLVYFLSSVGGAGSTTASVNIAWIMSNRHFKQTLMMDMNILFGTVHLMLDINAESSYLDVLESPDKIDDYFVETILKKYDNRLFYLGGLEDLMSESAPNIAAFEALLNLTKKQFNYIVVDAQRDVSGISRCAIQKADVIVLMVEMSIASAQNTARLLEFLSADHSVKRIMIIANKVGLSSAGALTASSFEKVIDRKIDYMLPLDQSITLAAANIGQPLALSASPLTDILETITSDIIGRKDIKVLMEEAKQEEGGALDKMKNKVLGMIGIKSAK